MTERLNSLEALRAEIKLECGEVFKEAYKEAANRAFLKIEQYFGDRLLPVEKKTIFFQMVVSDLQEYNYEKYLKKGSRGYSLLEKFSLSFFSISGFAFLSIFILLLGLAFVTLANVENKGSILFSGILQCVSLLIVYFGAGVVSKRTIESAFVKEIDDMFVRINTNWNIFSAVLNKRDAQPETVHKIKLLEGNYGMTGVLEFFASLVNTPYELTSTGFQLQGLDLESGNFERLQLIKANCTCTNFRGANLKDACFTGSVLNYAIFDNAILPADMFNDVASCEGVSLNNVNWV